MDFGIPDNFTGSNWLDAINDREKDRQRDYFMQEVHYMPNGSSEKYNIFFEYFLDKLFAYQHTHNPRMLKTPDDFYSLIRIIKERHRGQSPRLRDLVRGIKESHIFDNPDTHDPPTLQMIGYSIWLGIWAWLQITLQEKVRGGAKQVLEEVGQIVHPWNSDENVWTTIDNDLPRSFPNRFRKKYHEFSLRLNFVELMNATEFRITFKPTSNLLEHLRILKDWPVKYSMVVYIFHNQPMLYALFNGNNRAPEGHKDLAQEVLNTLVLLAPYDVNGGVASFQHIFGVNILERMEDEPFDYESDQEGDDGSDQEADDESDEEVNVEAGDEPLPLLVQDDVEPSVYISRSLHSYPNWGARLLELEEVVKGQNPSTFNEWHQEERDEETRQRELKAAKRDEDVKNITICAFILSVVLLILTILALVYGAKAVDQAKDANIYASIASVGADATGSQLSSFLTGCGVPFCTQLLGENKTVPVTITTVSPTLTPIFTVTATTFTTVTISDTVNVTSTVERSSA